MPRQITILSTSQFKKTYPAIYHHMFPGSDKIHFTKAHYFEGKLFGTFQIPTKDNPGNFYRFGFYYKEEEILFVDDSHFVKKCIEEMEERVVGDHFFFEFLQTLIKEDIDYLTRYETSLEELEENLLDRDLKDFDRRILMIRKDLLTYGSYYGGLIDLVEEFREVYQGNNEYLSFLLKRISRLEDTVHHLKEYSMQLKEMHASQVDLHQNEIMKILTVVTTIFMPLTLITGWYGMNFEYMPELSFPFSYLIVIIISLILIVGEILYFKKKKWFQ